ncbi:MAG: hypothetical protein Q9166_005526 [cf. Caloplaca sp. 2 TL-2023]
MTCMRNLAKKLKGTRQRKSVAESSSEVHECQPYQSSDDYSTTPIRQPKASSDSYLLKLLPFEIRQQIWAEVVGGNLFHMTADEPERRGGSWPQDALVGRYLCCSFSTGADSDVQTSYPRCQGSQKEPCFFSGPEKPSFRPLGLFLTCRQIYHDAISLLYSANTFNFDNISILVPFMNAVRRSNVAKIRTVHVNVALWRIRSPETMQVSVGESVWMAWTALWRLLARFESLQNLRLDIYGTSRAGLRPDDLEPLLKLQGLKTFDLAVWRDTNAVNSGGQDLSLSVPLQDFIRSSICK